MWYKLSSFTLLLLTIGLASPARAAKPVTPVTVEQLEKLLAASHGQSDYKLAVQLKNLTLTERATSVRMARWQADFPKRHCREALTELADASAFLALPASDMPANAPPDLETQKTLLTKTVHYVGTTLRRLPNFYATRNTEHFEDTPPHQTFGRSIAIGRNFGALAGTPTESEYVPMHSVGRSSITVTYSDGAEVTNSKQAHSDAQLYPSTALTTVGEFGPILSLVLRDAAHGTIAWGHWEQAAGSLLAVFGYAVPESQSHYMVTIPLGANIREIRPAYHGEIAVDPGTGSVLRISVISDFSAPYQKLYTAILVEYGDVLIGGAPYNCPIKGVALSKMPTSLVNGELDYAAPPQTQINDVAFTQYHLFRAESRIIPVTAGSDAPVATPPPQSPR